jgi:hypothetical protein
LVWCGCCYCYCGSGSRNSFPVPTILAHRRRLLPNHNKHHHNSNSSTDERAAAADRNNQTEPSFEPVNAWEGEWAGQFSMIRTFVYVGGGSEATTPP